MVTRREEKEKEKRKASHKALYSRSCATVGSGDVEPSKLAVTRIGVGWQWGYPAFRLDGACQDDKQRRGLMLSEGSFFFL